MAIDVNKVHLWPNYVTKDDLTPYTGGLACYKFDNNKVYNARHCENSYVIF